MMKSKKNLLCQAFLVFGFCLFVTSAFAEVAPVTVSGKLSIMDMVSTLAYGLIGIILAIIGYKIFDVITPFSISKELEIDQNIAVGIVVGCMIIGVCIIVAAAII